MMWKKQLRIVFGNRSIEMMAACLLVSAKSGMAIDSFLRQTFIVHAAVPALH